MLTFKQFLIEKFFKGLDGRMGYVEIYKNPTKYEIQEAARNARRASQLGAIVSGKDLYVWHRDDGDHADVKMVIPNLAPDWVPLYIYYNPGNNSADISVATFSMYSAERFEFNEDEILNRVKTHPAFKIFSSVKKF